MLDSARPEVTAFKELETLVRHLGDELAGFRRRALLAEARVRDLEELDARSTNRSQRDLAARCTELERENAALLARVDSATTRTRQMLERVRFIRQQTESTAAASDR